MMDIAEKTEDAGKRFQTQEERTERKVWYAMGKTSASIEYLLRISATQYSNFRIRIGSFNKDPEWFNIDLHGQ